MLPNLRDAFAAGVALVAHAGVTGRGVLAVLGAADTAAVVLLLGTTGALALLWGKAVGGRARDARALVAAPRRPLRSGPRARRLRRRLVRDLILRRSRSRVGGARPPRASGGSSHCFG